ncbi:site-specific integrase [Alistipes indistinctus]|uniref:site-specific integrase n=1 Tax=Alistipes indistinctus TaxID=626932 RepID=UPI00242F258C|nr:site-specific integrase [Alistipes indistinctus]
MVANPKIKRSYLFFPDKEKEGDGYKPDAKLRLRVRWSGRKVDFNVGYRIKLSQWDTQTQRCRVKTTNLQKQSASLINGTIQAFETAIDNVFTSFELEGISPTPDQIRAKFNLLAGRTNSTEVQTGKTLFDYFDDFTREMGNINSWTASTYAKFAAVRHHLETFNPSLQFADLTEFGLTQYVNYLREVKGMRNTTITKQLGFLKWFLRWATTKGYCQTLDYINFKPKLKTNEKKIIFLDWPELMTVYNYPFTDKQKTLERVRDVFCFCCFTSLRYSDVANLKRSDVFDSYISLTTIKTADNIKIELNKYSRAILDKYAHEQYPGNLALPVISNQKMNDYLKEVGKLCGIDQPVTITYYRGNERIDEIYPKYELLGTHAGRRTFICNALMMGIAPQVVMKWTGHSDYKAMKPYIDIADSAKVEAMKLFDK